MKKKTIVLLLSIMIIGAIIVEVAYAQYTTGADAQGISSPLAKGIKYSYAAKFVCGDGLQSEGAVMPGHYATAINVHNPQVINVTIAKKAVIALSEMKEPIAPSKKHSYKIQPDYAFEIDCRDIVWMLGGTTQPPFIKGFVVIETPRQLDVVGVYTSATADKTTNALDIETINPKIITSPIPKIAADLPLD